MTRAEKLKIIMEIAHLGQPSANAWLDAVEGNDNKQWFLEQNSWNKTIAELVWDVEYGVYDSPLYRALKE